jgi:hypothetical protein
MNPSDPLARLRLTSIPAVEGKVKVFVLVPAVVETETKSVGEREDAAATDKAEKSWSLQGLVKRPDRHLLPLIPILKFSV